MAKPSTALHDCYRRYALVGIAWAMLGAAAFVPFTGSSAVRAQGALPRFKVIVHPGNPISHITNETLRRAFLKQITHWEDDAPIKPVDLMATSAVRREFSRAVLGRSVDAVRSYWLQRIFAGGQTPPLELPSADAVIRFTATTRGAVGYVAMDVDATPAKAITLDVD